MKGLIIIPAYNEEKNIEKVLLSLRHAPAGFDHIVINDRSTDQTLQICKDLGAKVINLPINLGIGGAVQTGYRYALAHGYDMAVQIDGDGQHDAAFLPDMVKALTDESADMIIGSRFTHAWRTSPYSHSLRRSALLTSSCRRRGTRFFSDMIRLFTGERIWDPTSGLRLVNRRLIRMFAADYPIDYPEPESLTHILKAGCKVVEIPVHMYERSGGVSSIGVLDSFYYMLKVSTAITVRSL